MSQTGCDPVSLIDQLSPIERLCHPDRLAPDDPFLPELRARFGDRIVDGIAPAARPPRWALAASPSPWDGDSDLNDPDDLSDADYSTDDLDDVDGSQLSLGLA